MPKKNLSNNILYFSLFTILIIIIIILIVVFVNDSKLRKNHNNILHDIKSIPTQYNSSNNSSNNLQQSVVEKQFYPPVQEYKVEQPKTVQPIIINQPQQVMTQEQVALERIYNPLKYPYRSPDFYKQSWYPNQMLPANVIGCGARNTPCLGGTQIAIPNTMPPIDVSNRNIAPVNISTQGGLGQPQQVGAIYQIFGNENQVYPLFGRKRYRNGNQWDYYTTIGQYGVKLPIITKKRNEELGTNDTVFIQGQKKSAYRVTMYDQDTPEYIPYV